MRFEGLSAIATVNNCAYNRARNLFASSDRAHLGSIKTFHCFLFVPVSIYFAFIINAYSCDLENRRRSSLNYQPRRDFLPDCLKSHINKIRGKKGEIDEGVRVDEFTLNIVSAEDQFQNAPYEQKHPKKSSVKIKNKKHSIASNSNQSFRLKDDTSDSYNKINELE